MKLNIGCGLDVREGYINVDIRPLPGVDVLCDITKLHEVFPAGSADEVYASHVLEHIPGHEALAAVNSWRSLLKPTGKLIIRVPDLEETCRLFATATHAERYHSPGYIRAIYGNDWFPGNQHLCGYTEQRLCDLLHEAFFARLEVEKRTAKDAPELRVTAWFRMPSE